MDTIEKNPSVTVSIITCYGGASLIDTARSIRASVNMPAFRFVIVADRNGVAPEVKKELAPYNVEIIEKIGEDWTPHRKWRLIRDITTTDLLVLTQDDVIFEPDALAQAVGQFTANPETTIVNIRNIPAKPENIFEAGVNVGTRLANRIGELWNHGDNYIGLLGRAMVVRTEWFKKIELPDDVVSSDAYLYFLNKKMGGVYYNMAGARINFRNPQNMGEHWRKSSRFQYSEHEMQRYFTENLHDEYHVPLSVIVRAVCEEFVQHPAAMLVYSYIWIYTRLFKQRAEKALATTHWEVDTSTKRVGK